MLLYGSLVEAYTYMKGEADMMQLYEQRFAQEIQRLKDLLKLERIAMPTGEVYLIGHALN